MKYNFFLILSIFWLTYFLSRTSVDRSTDLIQDFLWIQKGEANGLALENFVSCDERIRSTSNLALKNYVDLHINQQSLYFIKSISSCINSFSHDEQLKKEINSLLQNQLAARKMDEPLTNR